MKAQELEWKQVYQTTACPTCKANHGERCRGIQGTGKGQIVPNHVRRTELFEEIQAQLKARPNRWMTIGATDSE